MLGTAFRAALVASCFRGALPPVDLLHWRGGTEEIQERKVETAEPLHAQQHFSGLDLRKTTTEETE